MNPYMIIQLIGGLVFFMFGMNVMSGSLEKMAGGKLEHMLKKMTKNPFVSLFLGAVITIAMQSSSATTVMLVGLVNSGIMSFGQTLNVIFGANIGTTLTVWLLAMSGISSDNFWISMLKPENFSPILAFIGILMMMFSKNDRKKSVGMVLVGFAVLMNGMDMMKNAVSPLADIPEFRELILKFNNPLFGVAIGVLVTAVIQSSAASIGILLALAVQTGAITFGMAIPIIMGQNIGTCATSLISCIGTNVKAKRVATVHLSIKIIGTIVWLTVFCIISNTVHPAFLSNAIGGVGISVVHTAFNILTTILLMPFTRQLVKMTEWLVREKKSENAEQEELSWLDDRLLRSPSVAVSECNSISHKMAKLACQNMYDAMGLFDHYDTKVAEKVKKVEDELDQYEDRLGSYLVKLSMLSLSDRDSKTVSKMLHTIGDLERIGDHAVNLYHAAEEIHDKGIKFTLEASAELRVLTNAIDEILALTTEAYRKEDIEIAAKVEPLEQVIDKLTSEIKSNHIARLQKGECTIEMGFVLSDVLNDYERISDHCSNIAVSVIEMESGAFDTHEYLNGVKCGNVEFNAAYDAYDAKYYLDR